MFRSTRSLLSLYNNKSILEGSGIPELENRVKNRVMHYNVIKSS